MMFIEGAGPDLEAAAVPLSEGLGSWVMELASGRIDTEIKELKEECRDVKTPEQQILVLTKIGKLLERAIKIRHGQRGFRKFVHDNTKRVASALGEKDAKGDPLKELDVRLRESITQLAAMRDRLLALRLPGSEETIARVERAKDGVREALQKATGGAADDEY